MNSKPMILIVDDDLFVRDLLKRYIEHIGYQSVQCAGAEEVYALLGSPDHPRVDVVLTDIQMPHVSGLEMLVKIHESDPDLPIAIITGVPTLDNSIAALNTGAYAFIVKPIQIPEVKGVIDKGLALAQKTRNQAALEAQLEAHYRTLESELLELQTIHPQGED